MHLAHGPQRTNYVGSQGCAIMCQLQARDRELFTLEGTGLLADGHASLWSSTHG